MFIVHVHCSLFMFIVHCSHGATLIFDDLYKLELNDILHPHHHHHYPYQLGLSREQPQKLIFLIFDLPAASRIEAAKEAAYV